MFTFILFLIFFSCFQIKWFYISPKFQSKDLTIQKTWTFNHFFVFLWLSSVTHLSAMKLSKTKCDTPHYCSNVTRHIIVPMWHATLLSQCDTPHYCSNVTRHIIVPMWHATLLFQCDMPHYCSNATRHIYIVPMWHATLLSQGDTPHYCSNKTCAYWVFLSIDYLCFLFNLTLFVFS